MKRVTKSRSILHRQVTPIKVDTWDGLIFAAESELGRIRERSIKLTQAIEVFKNKKLAGEPMAQLAGYSEIQRESATR